MSIESVMPSNHLVLCRLLLLLPALNLSQHQDLFTPVVKKLAQMITWVPGQGDRFQSMDFL